MHDDLRSRFEVATGRMSLPKGDLAAVARSGVAKRRWRYAATVLAAGVIVATGWFGVASRSGGGVNGPLLPPAGPFEERDPDFVMVPVVMKGGDPGTDVAVERNIWEARAVTVAFHALLYRTGYEAIDYKNVSTVTRGWDVGFIHGVEDTSLKEAIRTRREVVQETHERVQELERSRKRLLERLRKAARELRVRGGEERRRGQRSSRERAAALEETAEQMAEERARLEVELEQLEAYVRAQEELGGPFDLTLHVEEAGDRLVVSSVSTDSPSQQELTEAEGYSEPVKHIDIWGADYFNASFAGPGVVDDVDGLEMFGFWTSPVPSTYAESCRLRLTDAAGRVVWRQRKHPRSLFQKAVEPEDRRDQWVVGMGVDYEGTREGLRPEMVCRWRA